MRKVIQAAERIEQRKCIQTDTEKRNKQAEE